MAPNKEAQVAGRHGYMRQCECTPRASAVPSSAREDCPRRSNRCGASEVPASTGESSLPALRPCCRYRVQTPGCYSTRTGGPLMDSGGRAYKPQQSQCMQYARILLYISFVLLSFPLRPPVCPLAPRPAPPRPSRSSCELVPVRCVSIARSCLSPRAYHLSTWRLRLCKCTSRLPLYRHSSRRCSYVSRYGPIFIGVVFNIALYGIMVTQTYLYFQMYKRYVLHESWHMNGSAERSPWRRDKPWMKLLVSEVPCSLSTLRHADECTGPRVVSMRHHQLLLRCCVFVHPPCEQLRQVSFSAQYTQGLDA